MTLPREETRRHAATMLERASGYRHAGSHDLAVLAKGVATLLTNAADLMERLQAAEALCRSNSA